MTKTTCIKGVTILENIYVGGALEGSIERCATLDDLIGFFGGGLNVVEVDVGVAKLSGTFDITGTGFDTTKTLLISMACGPYTGKGTLADESEMDHIVVTGYVVDSTTIRCYWNSGSEFVRGNFKFAYSLN